MLFVCINFIYITTYIPGNDIPRLSTTTGSPSVSAVDFESANALQLTSATSSEPQNVAESKFLEFQGILHATYIMQIL